MKIHNALKIMSAATLAVLLSGQAVAQTSSTHQHPDAAVDGGSAELSAQLDKLRMKVRQLEHQMHSKTTGKSMSGMNSKSSPGMKMSGQSPTDTKKDMGMGGMKMKKPGMGGMSKMRSGTASDKNMGGMGMKNKNKGMAMMGMMPDKGGMSDMSMQSALPGFPGSSHLYHVGAAGFFLDHGEHITLTTDQQSLLNQLKEKSALAQATAERKIEEAEQQLWELTAAAEPDIKQIESKIGEIGKLQGHQRLAFIRVVGDAANVLTPEQQRTLTGSNQDPQSSNESSHQP